jgi:hypothetical protein
MNKLSKKPKKPIQVKDTEWGRLSQRICRIIEKVMDDQGLNKSQLAKRIKYPQSAFNDVFTPDDKGRKRRWSIPLLMAVCEELSLYFPDLIRAAWEGSTLAWLKFHLSTKEPRSLERLDAIVKAIAPGDASEELRDMFYNVHMFEVAAPEYVKKYQAGEISDNKVYEDLSEIIENADANFWACVKSQLNDAE